MILPEKPNEQAITENFEFGALDKAVNYRAAVLGEFLEPLRGRVLEMGAGIGQFTPALLGLPAVEEVVSIEPESRFCQTFRQHHPRLRLIEGTLDSLGDDFEWDAVVCINVLEHIRDDEAELAKCRRRLLRRRGHLCLFVPARQEIYGPLDRDFGHHRRYAKPELRRKLEQAGFEIVQLHYFNWIGYFAWWFSFRLLKRRRFNVGSIVLFDRVIFPVVHGLERNLLRPPFGQSLVAIARAGS
jgi:2-polyprenyl-3-methyl-5-hydroxy-6-metoxy-1,4-benzoquinol methylase